MYFCPQDPSDHDETEIHNILQILLLKLYCRNAVGYSNS